MRDLLKQAIKMYCHSLIDKLNNPKLTTEQVSKLVNEIKVFRALWETLDEQDKIDTKASQLG